MFTGRNTVDVNGKTLKFSAAVIATGATAAIPPIKGLKVGFKLPSLARFLLPFIPETHAAFAMHGNNASRRSCEKMPILMK